MNLIVVFFFFSRTFYFISIMSDFALKKYLKLEKRKFFLFLFFCSPFDSCFFFPNIVWATLFRHSRKSETSFFMLDINLLTDFFCFFVIYDRKKKKSCHSYICCVQSLEDTQEIESPQIGKKKKEKKRKREKKVVFELGDGGVFRERGGYYFFFFFSWEIIVRELNF